MSDSINIVVRFALYFDLMLLFGLAIFGLYSLRGKERVSGTVLNFESLLYGTSVAGVALSLAAMLLLAKAMSGVSELMELHRHIFEMVLMGTDVGLTWMVRIAALVMAIIGVALNKRFPTPSLWIVTVCGAIALATLAWTGHGAMDEGSRRYWHFITDIFPPISRRWLVGRSIGIRSTAAVEIAKGRTRSSNSCTGTDWF